MTTTVAVPRAPDRPVVLVVEDDFRVGAMMLRLLSAEGLGGDLAQSGEAALVMAAGATYSAVMIRQELPGMSGLEVCRRLRRGGLGVPALILTAHPDLAADIRPAGADACLAEPFSSDDLVDALRALPQRSPLAAGRW
jgi:two-component system, OmpR family, response regulator PrrA